MSKNPLNLQLTVAGAAILMVLGGAVWFGLGPSAEAPQAVTEEFAVSGPVVLTVHVSGAVVRPGVAVVASGSRIADVVAAAGGATSDADLAGLNLAAPVRDGERILVPSYLEVQSAFGSVETSGLDLNAATVGQLQDLDGVGPVLAGRIVEFREANGPFQAIEDLLDVPGIGEAKLAGMRGGIGYP